MPTFSPAYDNKIARKYSARTIEHKVENKIVLQEEVGWMAEPKQPIISIISGMTDALGGPLFEQLLPGLMELPVSTLVRGRGSNKYGEMLMKMSKSSGYKLKVISDNETSMRKMLAGSDMALFLAPVQDSSDIEHCLRYGVIPVSLPHTLLESYNPVQETGNAFTYEKATVWQCFASLVRAIETFKFPYDWRTIQRHAMETMHDTQEPVEE